jgi:hypothetical protein
MYKIMGCIKEPEKTKLNQKRGFNSRKYTLYEDRILVESKTVQQIDKYEVKLNKLGFEIQYQADNTFGRKIFLSICIAIPVIVTIFELTMHNIGKINLLINNFCWLSIAFLIILRQPLDNIFLVGGEKSLVFYRATPSEDEVLNFIEQVIGATKNNIKQKYLNYDEAVLGEEYLARVIWLKENEIITRVEFENLKNDFELRKLL